MPLESGTTIAQLDLTNPREGDPHNQGDDHLRLIKAVLKAQFPGVAGDGYAIPITTSEEELNYVTGVTSSIQDQLDLLDSTVVKLNAPQGTRLSFHQSTAPEGWTQDTDMNDTMMRVVGTAGGSSIVGTDSPTGFDPNLIVSPAGEHNHSVTIPGDNQWPSAAQYTNGYLCTYDQSGFLRQMTSDRVLTSSDVADHDHETSYDTWAPKYIDVIIAEKD